MNLAIRLVILSFFMLILTLSCKKKQEKQNSIKNTTSTLSNLSESKKIEIVKYYLKNKKKLTEENFHKIIFLNDNYDNVKVIYYKDKDAFFTFKFSEALQFNNNK